MVTRGAGPSAPAPGGTPSFDFEDGKDRLDVCGFGALPAITGNGTSAVTVVFDADDRVLVQGPDGGTVTLTAADFIRTAQQPDINGCSSATQGCSWMAVVSELWSVQLPNMPSGR